MKIFDHEIECFGEPFIVAEVSCNHKGSLTELLKTINVARNTGANAVKIQCYGPDNMTWDNGYTLKTGNWAGRNLYEIYKKSQTPLEWMEPVFDYARESKINLFSSVYDIEGLHVLEKAGCPAYKIASFENNDPYFVKRVVLTGKPVIISNGMLSINETISLVNKLPREYNNIAVLHCVSKYPTWVRESCLGRLPILIHQLPTIPIGFSDHTMNSDTAIAAIAMGACIIEKHLDGVYDVDSEDKHFSIGFTDFQRLVEKCKEIYMAVDRINLEAKDQEREIKRSLHVVKQIKAGEVITNEHIKSLRPYMGESPALIEKILGAKVKVDIEAGTPFLMEYLE